MNWKTAAALAIVGIAAIFIRVYPTMGNFAFGNDFGIYNTIAGDFLRSGRIFDTFQSPWGGAGYGDFPVMYWIVLGLAKLTGLNYTTMLVMVPPVFGGLCSIIVYFMAYRLTRNNIVSIFAAVFDAVNPVIVYQTSISSILVFGHFFGLLTVLFFIMYADNRRFFFPFMASAALLVMSHPLSTFMYLLAVLGITLACVFRGAGLIRRLHLALGVYSFSAFMFIYWYLFFNTFGDFMSGGLLHIPAPLLILAYYALASLILFFPVDRLSILRAGLNVKIFRNRISWLYFALASYAIVSLFSLIILFSVLKTISVADAASFLPLILDGALAIAGMYFAGGSFRQTTSGWLFLLGVALTYSVVTWNMVLYPGRYMEYLFEPLSLLEALGMANTLYGLRAYYRKGAESRDERDGVRLAGKGRLYISRKTRKFKVVIVPLRNAAKWRYNRVNAALAFLLLIFLVAASAATPYQVGNIVTPSGNQTISLPDYEAAKWLEYNGDRNYSVATDHILGLMVDSYNMSGTFEFINQTWSQGTITAEVLHELMGNDYFPGSNYTPVDYIMIDNYMFDKGVWGFGGLINPYSQPVRMTNQSFLKFLSPPFVPVYFNNTATGEWALVVQVNWTYVNAEFGTDVTTAGLAMFPQYVDDSNIINVTIDSNRS